MMEELATGYSYPTNFHSMKEWQDTLLEIAEGFKRYYAFENEWFLQGRVKDWEKEYTKVKKELDKSLKLFSKYFLCL